ncbi:MAG: CoA-binding protein [Bacteroidota bacterium]
MDSISTLAHNFLSMKSIAVIGISSSKQTVANGVYKKLKTPTRTVYAVGKNTTSFENEPCYPNLGSLPTLVQGVFVAAKPENTERIVDECIALHIPFVWIHHFGGTTFSSGSSAQPHVVKKCRDNGITVIPGACPMMFCDDADVGHKCIKWFLSITGKLT